MIRLGPLLLGPAVRFGPVPVGQSRGSRPGGYSMPSWVQEAAATRDAYPAASAQVAPRDRAVMIPAAKASPAPLVHR